MASDQSDDSPRMRWTYIEHTDPDKEWPFNTVGFIYHREDLKGVESPYLEWLKEALERGIQFK